MDDYISRQAAIEALMKHKGMTPIAKLEAETTICRVPSTDVVEVVRCKDCKHRYSAVSNMTIDGNETWCHECLNRIPIRLDLYCAD